MPQHKQGGGRHEDPDEANKEVLREASKEGTGSRVNGRDGRYMPSPPPTITGMSVRINRHGL